MAMADDAHADVLRLDGITYVSPRSAGLRVLAATVAFHETEPIELARRFVSTRQARRAERTLARLRRREPDSVSFVQESPWHAPIRWFVLFEDDERWLGNDPSGRLRLRYRTRVRKAMRRAERAIPVLRRSDLGPVAELLVELHAWLASFDPSSILDLDYSTLCDLMTWDELDDDRTARELHESLSALEAGEFPRSSEIYQAVLGRWAEVRGREVLN